MKHVYRILIILVVFLGTAVIATGNKKVTQGVSTTKVKCVEQAKPTFPTMVVRTQNYDINVLHGYNSNLKASINRESITPVGIDKKFQLVIQENEMVVRKLRYELRKVNDNALLDSGEIAALEKTDAGKIATMSLDSSVEQGKEYALKITAITKEGKKIHYFTHLKYYGSDSFLKEKIDFVLDFHNKTLQKNKASELASYLEISNSQNNDNFANVDIHSSEDMVTWGQLEPTVVSDIVPTVKEFNIETGAICLNYFVKIKSGDGQELCKVKEFFRVRYSGGRIYLLKYDRDMLTMFSVDNTSLSSSQFKLGITKPQSVQVVYSEDKSHMAFVSAGELWSYYLNENQLARAFSFSGDSKDYLRAAYDQHNIKVIKIDNDGNMDFMVYGYMNSGDYEGCVGIVWYKYYSADKRIEEQVFIPMETTYQIMKENLDSFSYVSDGNIFYFSIQNVIYSYDVVSKQLKVIAKDVEEGDYCYVESVGLLAWQSNSDDNNSTEIVSMNLDTKQTTKLKAGKNERIILIGSIDENIVYGLAKADSVLEQEDGSKFTPMYKICIVNKDGRELKTYKEKGIYVKSATVEDNVVRLKRVKKVGNSYKNIKADSIQNQEANQTEDMGITSRVTEKNLKEYYVYLKPGFTMTGKPGVSDVKNTMIGENKIVRLDGNETNISRYYVYAEGVIIGAYTSPAKAINVAENAMGVVVNEENQLVYERAGKYTNNQIGNVEKVSTGNGVNSKGACLAMLLKFNHISADAKKLSDSPKSAYRLLTEKLDKQTHVVNLKGCTLDEVLYFVSGNRPVIAMTGENSMVLLTAYTETSVTFVNPANGKEEKKSISAAEDMFRAAGNSFISYIK